MAAVGVLVAVPVLTVPMAVVVAVVVGMVRVAVCIVFWPVHGHGACGSHGGLVRSGSASGGGDSDESSSSRDRDSGRGHGCCRSSA